MKFKKINSLLVNHVRTAMSRYLQTQPNWADASLFLTMSQYRHLLLIKDETGIPGSFIQIPNILHNVYSVTSLDDKQIPLFRMVLRLVLDGRYLILSDCSDGVTFLLGHRTESPIWGDIRAVALNYNYGPVKGFSLNTSKANAICDKLAIDSYSKIDKLVGKRWKIYYAWNLNDKLVDNCMEIMFKNATPMIINRIWNDMYEYLESQPSWVAATLLMSKTPHQEMLLFADEQIPGRYIGVANIVRSEKVRPHKKSVPLFKIQMRLYLDGRYLLLADCNIGVITLSVHQTPFRGEMEIAGVADSLHLGYVIYFLIKDTIAIEIEVDDGVKIRKEPITASPKEDPDDPKPTKAAIPEEPQFPHNWSDIMVNTTSCDEYLANVTFDPFKVLDIDWKIWYYWNQHFEESYEIKFSIPSRTLVDRFRVELDDEIKPRVEWDDAILFMETSIDFSALFIKTAKDGQFRVIPSLAFEFSRLPEVIFGMKVIEPYGYLALLNCKYRICYALAPVNNMPYYGKYEEEAKKIGFRGEFGRSYITISPAPPPMEFEDDLGGLHDDDEEDIHLEIQKQFNDKMQSVLV
ncbi:unnamed protein product [Arctia plantaginis]|uniref:Uncharacterized protein n=1 Tax=Arctia plantaginis TaxID=874455 RepID=A0A8S1ALD2_ARCPL|nr:unnamed protein product [Arctia plantaginis]